MPTAPEPNGSASGRPDAHVGALGVYQAGDAPALAFPALVRAAELELGLGVRSATAPSSSVATGCRGARAPASLRSERIANVPLSRPSTSEPRWASSSPDLAFFVVV